MPDPAETLRGHMSALRSEYDVDTVPASPYASYARLMAMLARGWQIEGPVYVRPTWRRHSQGGHIHYFIVWREGKVRVVGVLDGPEIRAFLAASNLTVDRL
jgi:hypothetical protein